MSSSPRDFDDAKVQIKDRVDLMQLVAESVPLKRTGSSFKGLCPFHGEKTPSFHVFPGSQTFKCFGCGKGGDVFTWVMETESLGFFEAMKLLAERAGVALPEQSEESRQQARVAKTALQLLSELQGFYLERLRAEDAAEARQYMEQRGLAPAQQLFGIGYMPGPRAGGVPEELARWLRGQRVPKELALELGLIFDTRQGPLDRFRHRLSFPIHDERGRVVGFGGRILPGYESEREPKYLNSPESPVFSKRRLLFGLHQARRQKAKRLVVMEGYTDVIAAQMAGVAGAVATLGTALTRQHASLLRRFSSDGVVLLFDGDAAGRRAAERAFHVLAPEELEASVCLLPEGLDPADLVQEQGAEALEKVLAAARPAWQVFVELLGDRCNLSSPEGRQQAAGSCRELLSGIEEFRRRRLLAEQLGRVLMIPEEVLLPQRRRQGSAAAARPAPASVERDSEGHARDSIFAALLAEPGLLVELEERMEDEESFFPKELPRLLLGQLRDSVISTGDVPSPDELLSSWMTTAAEIPGAVQHLSSLADLARTFEDPRLALLGGVDFLDRKRHARELSRLKEGYRQALAAGDEAAARELELALQQALRRRAP